ncbi:hypothetical protein [Nocardiopsis changdeensis]|uniref:hypothetical protein n=1 Tax=Nocardiopsis changdeensis TaxID=2831969 RepID=UPI003F4523FD
MAPFGVLDQTPQGHEGWARREHRFWTGPDPLLPVDPSRIGPYTLHARLGGGGMGRVYPGRSPGGRTVAVKVVRPDLAQDSEFRRRFATEVAAARKVGGFYTAQVVDAGTDTSLPRLATAYIPGPTLHRAVTDHGPYDVVLEIIGESPWSTTSA